MNIDLLISKKEKSIKLLKEYEEAKEIENSRVQYIVDCFYYPDGKTLCFIILDKNGKTIYDGTKTEIKNWFERRSINPNACAVKVVNKFENIYYKL